jgi:hypothetical protein
MIKDFPWFNIFGTAIGRSKTQELAGMKIREDGASSNTKVACGRIRLFE